MYCQGICIDVIELWICMPYSSLSIEIYDGYLTYFKVFMIVKQGWFFFYCTNTYSLWSIVVQEFGILKIRRPMKFAIRCEYLMKVILASGSVFKNNFKNTLTYYDIRFLFLFEDTVSLLSSELSYMHYLLSQDVFGVTMLTFI